MRGGGGPAGATGGAGTLRAVSLRGEIVEDVEALEPHLEQWDRLAVVHGLPYCAPGWVLPWWRHMAADGARLRVVLALDGDRLAGIAPFYARPWIAGLTRYEILGSSLTARIEPLRAPERSVEEVAAVFARTLAAARPAPDALRFEGLPPAASWPWLMGRAWPGGGRPVVHTEVTIPAPVVSLREDDFEAWMKGKSGNFRQQMRRSRRQLEKAGAVFRTAGTPEEVAAGLPAFERLHLARWEQRGGSQALTPGAREMLGEAGRALVGAGRFRLDTIEIDGRPISSQLFVSAGAETSYWLGGFEEAYAAQRPSMVALVAAVADGFRRGDARLDLGPGGQRYKYRLADGEEGLRWLTLVPPGPHRGRALALVLVRRARDAVAASLSPEAKARLRRALGLRVTEW